MKAKLLNPDPNFNPLRIELTIESKEELFELWHRLNANGRMFTKANGYNEYEVPGLTENGIEDEGSGELWDVLDNALVDMGIRTK